MVLVPTPTSAPTSSSTSATSTASDPTSIEALYDTIQTSTGLDVAIDDRAQHGVGWKLNDADLIGYPIIVVLGKTWPAEAEVQCRRLGVKEQVAVEDLVERITEYSARL